MLHCGAVEYGGCGVAAALVVVVVTGVLEVVAGGCGVDGAGVELESWSSLGFLAAGAPYVCGVVIAIYSYAGVGAADVGVDVGERCLRSCVRASERLKWLWVSATLELTDNWSRNAFGNRPVRKGCDGRCHARVGHALCSTRIYCERCRAIDGGLMV